jgi:alkylation response protein AidB-like acyl-CoA dehydrogenase
MNAMTTTTRSVPELKGDPIEIARSLSPLLAEYDYEIDKTGRVPESVMSAIMDTGLPWMMMPKRAGGAGLTMRTEIETIAELARASAGAAWHVNLLMHTTGGAASFPEPAFGRVFRTGRELFCGVLPSFGGATVPTQTARSVEDGYIVNGRWGYASGSQYADWGMGAVAVVDSGGGVVGDGLALMPIGHGGLSIDNTWDVAGMRGSASDTLVAEDVLVPCELVVHNGPQRIAFVPPVELEPRDLWPFGVIVGLALLAPVLGAAKNLLERTLAGVGKKPIVHWDYPRQADSQVVLAQIGEAAMEIDTAWMHVLRGADAVDAAAQSGGVSPDEQVRLQAGFGFAMKMTRQASERLMDVGGSSAFAMSSPMQRAWRDIALGSRHSFVQTSQSLELYGRHLAGERLPSLLFRGVVGQA